MTAPPPQWGAPQQQQASWGAPLPPQWAGSAPTSEPPAWSAPPASRSVLGTVFAHLVLWLGLLVVALAYRVVLRLVLVQLDFLPYQVTNGIINAVTILPVLVALVIAGRGATLRLVGLLGAVVLLAGSIVFAVVAPGRLGWPMAAALAVLGLGTWIVVRRHAWIGLLVLIPAAVLAWFWYGPLGLDLRAFPYEHLRSASPFLASAALLLWNDLIVLALAVFGLVSSLLRPRPEPGRDGIAFAVVGGLTGVCLVAGVVSAVV